MLKNRYWRWIALALTLLVLLSVIFIFLHLESVSCMGVIIRSAEDLSGYREKTGDDLSYSLRFNGEPCAVDVTTSTVYISQNISDGTAYGDLFGTLSVSLLGHSLYFEENEYFYDLDSAVKNGEKFRLLIVTPDQKYAEYSVVFTTLPVVRLDGEYSHMNSSGREVNSGSVCLWSPFDTDLGRYSVKSSATEWNIRGATSAILAKKPYKLSLKTKKGNNNDVAFLGLGEDDDWILNPMNTDDSDVREKLAMSLWNEISAESEHSRKMSEGEYVEVVINGSYNGLYLLQRRIDNKYLELDRDDILFKGLHTWTAETPRQGYEISYSNLSEDETFALLENLNSPDGKTSIDLDSFIDVSLFIQLGAMNDNKGYNNMYYLLEPSGGGYSLSFVPWDTDISFGIAYNNWFVYDYEAKLNALSPRMELGLMERSHPDIYASMARRWFELRETTFSLENINSIIEDNTSVLTSSGVNKRDIERWGKFHGGKDSVDTVGRFIEEKIALLDKYYGAFLESEE